MTLKRWCPWTPAACTTAAKRAGVGSKRHERGTSQAVLLHCGTASTSSLPCSIPSQNLSVLLHQLGVAVIGRVRRECWLPIPLHKHCLRNGLARLGGIDHAAWSPRGLRAGENHQGGHARGDKETEAGGRVHKPVAHGDDSGNAFVHDDGARFPGQRSTVGGGGRCLPSPWAASGFCTSRPVCVGPPEARASTTGSRTPHPTAALG